MDKNSSAKEYGKNRISVVINTYNAARFLREVLEAVKGFDEVVICDMESTDDTLSIAEEFKCRIVHFPKGNHVCAEPARTFAIQSASNPWVLVVDADEIVTPGLKEELYDYIRRPDCPQGLYIPRQNRFMNVLEKKKNGDWQLRFFIRKGTTWPPYVHTFPTVQGRVERLRASRPDALFIHLAENYIGQRLAKINQYSDGEVEKKAGRHYGVGALVWRPTWRFFQAYFLKGGIRNGLPGLISSLLEGFYQVVLVSKIIETKYRNRK